MPSRTGHPGTRRAHYRKGKPVRAAAIRHPKTQQRRRQVGRQVQQGRKPLLWGAGMMAGLGALEAILGGRFFTATLLFGVAGGFLIGHVVWQHHKNRQAQKPAKAKQQTAAGQQRREALEKAPAAHQPAPASSSAGNAAHKPAAEPTSHSEWQTRYGRRCDCADCRKKRRAEQLTQAKMASARKRAFTWKSLTGRGNSDGEEPTGTRRAPAKTGAWKQPPLSSDDSKEPIGARWEPPKRAVQQTDGTTANLYTPRKTTRKEKANR